MVLVWEAVRGDYGVDVDEGPITNAPGSTSVFTTPEGSTTTHPDIDKCEDVHIPWKSSGGYTCEDYVTNQWCNDDGCEGPGWQKDWGKISDYADPSTGWDANDACCGCGGGEIAGTLSSTMHPHSSHMHSSHLHSSHVHDCDSLDCLSEVDNEDGHSIEISISEDSCEGLEISKLCVNACALAEECEINPSNPGHQICTILRDCEATSICETLK